jgi:hypothetical protein
MLAKTLWRQGTLNSWEISPRKSPLHSKIPFKCFIAYVISTINVKIKKGTNHWGLNGSILSGINYHFEDIWLRNCRLGQDVGDDGMSFLTGLRSYSSRDWLMELQQNTPATRRTARYLRWTIWVRSSGSLLLENMGGSMVAAEISHQGFIDFVVD